MMRRIMLGLDDSPLSQHAQYQPGQQQRQQRQGQDNGEAQQPPMLQLLQQLMDGSGGGGPGGGGGGGLPPGLAQLLGQEPNNNNNGQDPTLRQAQQGPQDTTAQAARLGNRSARIWRIVHALSAFLLGLYIVFATSFDGSKAQRHNSLVGGTSSFDTKSQDIAQQQQERVTNFFWVFATVELLLQSTRFFLDKGRLQGSGSGGGGGEGEDGPGSLAGMIDMVLPEPYREGLRLLRRYSTIISTVVGDAMVVVFVLGSVAWWKGH